MINMLLPFNPRVGLETQRANPFLSQFVSERTSSSTRADNQHHATVIQIKCSWHKLKLLHFYPIHVVEAAMEITALIIGRPFVSEARPNRRITVEVNDEVRPQPLKEGCLLNPFESLLSRLLSEASPRGPCLAVQSLDSHGEETAQFLVLRRFFVELSNDMLVKLVGNVMVREHDPIDGDELFDEFRIAATLRLSFRSHRNRGGNSNCWVHWGNFPFL